MVIYMGIEYLILSLTRQLSGGPEAHLSRTPGGTPGTGVSLWSVRLSGFAEAKKSTVREPKGVHNYGH
jgi:hypothetical protein